MLLPPAYTPVLSHVHDEPPIDDILLVQAITTTVQATIAMISASATEQADKIIKGLIKSPEENKGCSLRTFKKRMGSWGKGSGMTINEQSLGVNFTDTDDSRWSFWAIPGFAYYSDLACPSCEDTHNFVLQPGFLSVCGDKSRLVKGKMLIDIMSNNQYHAFAPEKTSEILTNVIPRVQDEGDPGDGVCMATKMDEYLVYSIVPDDDHMASRIFVVKED